MIPVPEYNNILNNNSALVGMNLYFYAILCLENDIPNKS
jgi:hypothetical protein